MRHFEVIGDELDGGEIMGGGYDEVVGAVTASGRVMKLPPKPGWRSQLAPGVIQPDEGMIPLPLVGNIGSNTFTAAVNQITFQGTLQKPFRGERLLVSTVRTGASAIGRLLTLLFVGTDLQLADINGIDIELVGQAGAFGTRLTMKAAEPGVLVRFQSTLSTALAGTDTILVSMMLLGRVVH
jgi:hypothetical protein